MKVYVHVNFEDFSVHMNGHYRDQHVAILLIFIKDFFTEIGTYLSGFLTLKVALRALSLESA